MGWMCLGGPVGRRPTRGTKGGGAGKLAERSNSDAKQAFQLVVNNTYSINQAITWFFVQCF